MNPKIFVGWAFAAVVFAIAAIATALNQPAISTVDFDHERAFPQVRHRLNDVSKITITTSGESFALTRDEDAGWVAVDRFNYPVASKKVRDLIVTMADMRLVEPKTAREELFPRLEVEDADLEGSKSRLVRLETDDGEIVAEAIFGKTRYRLTGTEGSGTYIRRPDERQAWLASGKVSADKDIEDWLEKDVVDVENETVRSVRIAPLDGTPYSAERPGKDSEFHVTGIPEGRTVRQGATDSLASVLAGIDLQDVKPRSALEMPAERHAASVTTFDGVEVSVEFARIGDENWAVFSTRYVGEAAEATEEAEAARKRAEEINARVDGWVYQIADYIAKRLSTPVEDLLEAAEETS